MRVALCILPPRMRDYRWARSVGVKPLLLQPNHHHNPFPFFVWTPHFPKTSVLCWRPYFCQPMIGSIGMVRFTGALFATLPIIFLYRFKPQYSLECERLPGCHSLIVLSSLLNKCCRDKSLAYIVTDHFWAMRLRGWSCNLINNGNLIMVAFWNYSHRHMAKRCSVFILNTTKPLAFCFTRSHTMGLPRLPSRAKQWSSIFGMWRTHPN
ncbi:hypothetical protein THIOKS12340008 [Thiocapsa sp. KS1]|nr:hypothetical protein THIOKS12340008 [Thiocapsa sp. KS1]